MIADISRELQKLRDVAHALRLPNADKINWTIIRSSSSYSASTQKRFNKLVEERIEEDYARFGPVSDCPDLKELVENFCCMHLAVNLRKAFFNTEDSSSDNASSDVLVHEFCKLLRKNGSKHGTPEYCHGASGSTPNAYIGMARGSPCVVPSRDRRHSPPTNRRAGCL